MSEIHRIPLTMGKEAIVDASDYEWLIRFNWKYDPDGYAMRNALAAERNGRGYYNIRMHREITKAEKGMQVDHINGDTLDNRRGNLRVCTKTENGRNRNPVKGTTSRFKGVCMPKGRVKWWASIHVNDKKLYLGSYENEEEAARVYDKAALEHFGEYARLNFPAVLDAVGVTYGE